MPRNRGRQTQRRAGIRQRRLGERAVRQRLLIVCEGEQTEPNYFSAFQDKGRLSNVQIHIIRAAGDPLRVVERAKGETARYWRREEKFDQIWCVFDRDQFVPERFNRALQIAGENRFQVAYSNPCFELWYLLHFEFCQSAIHRHDYPAKLTHYLHRPYAKNAALFDALWDRQQTAIRNAAALLAQYDPSDPANNDPSTTVHLLVLELRRYL